jgi:crotonobetainyl-CoA:carnitine CoA-transferase CaiB-like acyl-CoA transferase
MANLLQGVRVLEHPQVEERGLIRRFPGAPGVDQEIAVVRAGFRLANGDPEPASPPPGLGENTERILGELGHDDTKIEALRRERTI